MNNLLKFIYKARKVGKIELKMKNDDETYLHILLKYTKSLSPKGQEAILCIAKNIDDIDIDSKVNEENIKKLIKKYKN